MQNKCFIGSEAEAFIWPFWASFGIKPKGRKRDNLLTRIIDFNYQEEIRLATIHGGKEDYVWNQWILQDASQTAVPNSHC